MADIKHGQLLCTKPALQATSDAMQENAPFIFKGQKEFLSTLENCIIQTCEEGANTLIFCDTDFVMWPLSNNVVIHALRRWANSTSNQRMLTMLAATYAFLPQQHDLWLNWRKVWSHRVKCLQTNTQTDSNIPCVFWSDVCMLLMEDKSRCIGRVSYDKQSAVRQQVKLQEIMRQSEPALPVATLGLW